MKALYVTDRHAAGDTGLDRIIEALAGAPGLAVQLRERNVSDRDCLDQAFRARRGLGASTPLYINRRLDIAIAAGADGVHLPEAGLPLSRVRAAAPRGLRIGVSTHSAEAAAWATEQGADLVVLGPVFETPSKKEYGPPLGPGALRSLPLLASHRSDVFAIGGVTEENLDRLEPYRDRISGIAAIRLFQESPDPRALVARIAER
jgi:thiamine-phosphate pyrophosphorylase